MTINIQERWWEFGYNGSGQARPPARVVPRDSLPRPLYRFPRTVRRLSPISKPRLSPAPLPRIHQQVLLLASLGRSLAGKRAVVMNGPDERHTRSLEYRSRQPEAPFQRVKDCLQGRRAR